MRRTQRSRRDQSSHRDDWLITYADMITLLLCLFAVFLSITLTKKEPLPKVETPPIVVESVNKPVDIFDGKSPFHSYTDQTNSNDDTPPEAVPQKEDKPVASEVPPVVVAPQPQDATPSQPVVQDPAPEQAAPAPEEPISDTAAPVPALAENVTLPSTAIPSLQTTSLPEIMDRLKSQGTANIEQKGDRITTLEISSTAFFGSGSAVLSASGKSILQDVASNLKSDKFKDYQVTVEGHTDDIPINTFQFPSNWELSTARASAVVHFFIEQGVSPKKLRAAGYADTFPIAPNKDASGKPIPENEARNRRVVIKLEKIDKKEP